MTARKREGEEGKMREVFVQKKKRYFDEKKKHDAMTSTQSRNRGGTGGSDQASCTKRVLARVRKTKLRSQG